MRPFKNGCACFTKVYLFFHRHLLWNPILRFFLEGYLDFTICTFINVSIMKFGQTSEIVNAVVSLFLLIVCLILPIFVLLFLSFQRAKLAEEFFEQRFGSLYEGIHHRKKIVLFYTFCFLIRRLVFSASCVFITDFATIQLQLYCLCSLFNIIILGYVRPFTAMNHLELYNECTILVISYHLFTFTDFVDNESDRDGIGYSLVAITCLNIFVNFIIMLYQSFFLLKRFILKLWHKRCRRKAGQSSKRRLKFL